MLAAPSGVSPNEVLLPWRECTLLDTVLARRVAAKTPLRVASDGGWFEDAAGRHGLGRRRAARRVLCALAAHRANTGVAALDQEALVQAGWPGERMHPHSARDRPYAVIRDLRQLGLGDVIETVDGGYRFDPAVVIEQVQVTPGRR